MEAVNLLPVELRPGARWKTVGRRADARRVLTIAGIGAGAIALLLAALTLYQSNIVEDRRAELAQVEARLVAAEAKAAAIRAAQAESASRLAAVRDLVSRRVVWEDVLQDLSRVLPPNVWLQSLQATAAAAGSPGSTGFTVTGSADSQVRVAQVMERLALLPWLQDVALTSSAHGGAAPTPVTFTITALFRTLEGR